MLRRAETIALHGALGLVAWMGTACSADASLELRPRPSGAMAMFGPPADGSGGVLIGVELVGAAAARAQAAEAWRESLGQPPLGPLGEGETLGWVPARSDVLAFLEQHAFTTADDPTHAAPMPGGPIAARFDVVVESFVLTPRQDAGSSADEVALGSADAVVFTDEELDARGWMLADLTVDRAPLFAAPSPVLPPAREAYGVAERRGEIIVLDRLERCRETDCVRWVRALVRSGARFVPGYLPAAVVAPRRAWVPSADALPRAIALASSRHGGRVHFVVLARDPSGRLHREGAVLPGDAFVEVDVHLENDAVVLHGTDGQVTHVPIRVQ